MFDIEIKKQASYSTTSFLQGSQGSFMNAGNEYLHTLVRIILFLYFKSTTDETVEELDLQTEVSNYSILNALSGHRLTYDGHGNGNTPIWNNPCMSPLPLQQGVATAFVGAVSQDFLWWNRCLCCCQIRFKSGWCF